MRGVPRVLTGDCGQVSNSSSNVINVVDGHMLYRSQKMGYREVTAYRSVGSYCYSWIKKRRLLFSYSAALFEIGNDSVSCSGLVDTAGLIPFPSLNKTVG